MMKTSVMMITRKDIIESNDETVEDLTVYGTAGTFIERYAKYKGYNLNSGDEVWEGRRQTRTTKCKVTRVRYLEETRCKNCGLTIWYISVGVAVK